MEGSDGRVALQDLVHIKGRGWVGGGWGVEEVGSGKWGGCRLMRGLAQDGHVGHSALGHRGHLAYRASERERKECNERRATAQSGTASSKQASDDISLVAAPRVCRRCRGTWARRRRSSILVQSIVTATGIEKELFISGCPRTGNGHRGR
jgi:hypothetical protein